MVSIKQFILIYVMLSAALLEVAECKRRRVAPKKKRGTSTMIRASFRMVPPFRARYKSDHRIPISTAWPSAASLQNIGFPLYYEAAPPTAINFPTWQEPPYRLQPSLNNAIDAQRLLAPIYVSNTLRRSDDSIDWFSLLNPTLKGSTSKFVLPSSLEEIHIPWWKDSSHRLY